MRVEGSTAPVQIGPKPIQLAEASVSSEKGVVTVEAGDKNDEIKVTAAKDRGVDVKVNGDTYHFSRAEVEKGLVVKGGGGNDFIRVDAGVDVPVRVEGDAGKDTILNSAKGTTINGGAGDDTIINAGANAKINAGAGDNKILNTGDGTRIERDNQGFDKIESGANDTFIRSRGPGPAEIRVIGSGNRVEASPSDYVEYSATPPISRNERRINAGQLVAANGGLRG